MNQTQEILAQIVGQKIVGAHVREEAASSEFEVLELEFENGRKLRVGSVDADEYCSWFSFELVC